LLAVIGAFFHFREIVIEVVFASIARDHLSAIKRVDLLDPELIGSAAKTSVEVELMSDEEDLVLLRLSVLGVFIADDVLALRGTHGGFISASAANDNNRDTMGDTITDVVTISRFIVRRNGAKTRGVSAGSFLGNGSAAIREGVPSLAAMTGRAGNDASPDTAPGQLTDCGIRNSPCLPVASRFDEDLVLSRAIREGQVVLLQSGLIGGVLSRELIRRAFDSDESAGLDRRVESGSPTAQLHRQLIGLFEVAGPVLLANHLIRDTFVVLETLRTLQVGVFDNSAIATRTAIWDRAAIAAWVDIGFHAFRQLASLSRFIVDQLATAIGRNGSALVTEVEFALFDI
jgi:hypothetical protein